MQIENFFMMGPPALPVVGNWERSAKKFAGAPIPIHAHWTCIFWTCTRALSCLDVTCKHYMRGVWHSLCIVTCESRSVS
jgi:hypothetical protein